MQEVQGMKWFKFLIYFALFAGAVLNLLSLTLNIINIVMIDDLDVAFTSSSFRWAFAVMIVYSVFLLALAVMLIVTRFRLANFKSDGPILLYVIHFTNFVISLAYCIAVSYILGVSVFGIFEIIYLIYLVAMFQINYIYLENRGDLFKKKKQL